MIHTCGIAVVHEQLGDKQHDGLYSHQYATAVDRCEL